MENIKLAIEKLENEIEDNDNNSAIKRIGEYLINACDDSKRLSDAILNEDKNLAEAYEYISERARKQAVNGCACIEDSVVFEWAVDYFLEQNNEHETEQEIEHAELIEKPTKKRKVRTIKRTTVERETEREIEQLKMIF